MKIYKFGGASIKDVESIKNVAEILKLEKNEKLVVVISAMGKMTNAFESLIHQYLRNKKCQTELDFIKQYHFLILENLFSKTDEIFSKIQRLFVNLESDIKKYHTETYDFFYDQIVCYGELLSSTIISEYLQNKGIKNTWKDVRELIKTDATYRDAQVNWKLTEETIKKSIDTKTVTLVQGFLGGTENKTTTTLGREGSDYTAGIFAYCLHAENVTIWKDVQGVLNGDPKNFENTKLLNQISYEETIELAFYGATVIHPKTIQPLQKKEIPLWVKSYNNPKMEGTKISRGVLLDPLLPCFVVKKNQILVSISTKDFSFMVEKNISHVFKLLHQHQLKVSLLQNSAISFSVCVDNKFAKFPEFLTAISENYKVSYTTDVDLYTIRHFTNNSLKEIYNKGETLLVQTTENTTQIVLKPNI